MVWYIDVGGIPGHLAKMSNLPKTQEFNQFKPAPNPPGVTTPGIHTGEPYVPSSDMAWGARGKWEGKAWTDVSFERQVAKTKCVVGYDGWIDDARCATRDNTDAASWCFSHMPHFDICLGAYRLCKVFHETFQ